MDFPNEVELLELNRTMTIKIGKWTPPQRPQWVKEVMRTPGHTKVQLLLLLILTTSSVLSTGLQIYKLANNTSAGNTSTNLESLEVSLGRLSLKVTGKNTMAVVRSLIKIENILETQILNEK